MIRLFLLTAFILALRVATVHAQVVAREVAVAAMADTTATVFTEIREEYRAAASTRDVGTLSRLFADDGVLVATERDVLRGRQAIASYFTSAFAADKPAPVVTFTRISAEDRDGFGSETGRFEERLTTAEGTEMRVSGVYVVIYRRDAEGRWRIAIEIRSRGEQQPLGNW
jgi:uncharacterized protein (TIGR02246 family)